MKWTCPKCGAINPELSWKCHMCTELAPVIELVAGNGTGPLKISEAPSVIKGAGPFKTLQELEKEHILLALETFGFNKTKAANALGITIKTMYNKLHNYNLFEQYKIHGRNETSS